MLRCIATVDGYEKLSSISQKFLETFMQFIECIIHIQLKDQYLQMTGSNSKVVAVDRKGVSPTASHLLEARFIEIAASRQS